MANNSPLPPMVPFPPASLRRQISETDWISCLEAWTLLAKAHLSLSVDEFQNVVSTPNSTLIAFLTSFMDGIGRACADVNHVHASKVQNLHREVFLLVHRTLMGLQRPPNAMLNWIFLGNLSRMFRHSERLKPLVEQTWTRYASRIEPSLIKYKAVLISQLDRDDQTLGDDDVFSLALLPLARACPPAAILLTVGSDLVDSIVSAYSKSVSASRSKLLLLLYLGFNALLDAERPNHSLLLDHLYSLKAAAEAGKTKSQSLAIFSDIVTHTPLLSRIRRHIHGTDAARASNLISSLEQYQKHQRRQPKKHIHRKINKGKGSATDEYGHGFDGVHVRRMSLVTQIQELFPNLGSGFIIKLLDEYNNNVEQIAAHILEDSLPPRLQIADRSEDIDMQHQIPADLALKLIPHSTPPPSSLHNERRNIFDNDDFDRLAISTSQLHIGRRNAQLTADALLATPDDSSRNKSKAAILSALAAFDADDDEHDDTYDLEDVGGTVDSARPGGVDEADAEIGDMREKNEEVLFSAFSMSPGLFERDSGTRRGQPRQALKGETGMTDEAIEGWAVMVKRDPRRLRRLEAKYATFAGQQRELGSTSWREGGGGGGSGTEDSEASGAENGRADFGGRGKYKAKGGSGRGGGSVAGMVSEKRTQILRDGKEANKGLRANHNRRDQRAKKMARGGFPPT